MKQITQSYKSKETTFVDAPSQEPQSGMVLDAEFAQANGMQPLDACHEHPLAGGQRVRIEKTRWTIPF